MTDPPTLTVEHPAGYEAERTYVIDVMLATILGVRHRSRPADRNDVAITITGEDEPCLRIADVLFATPESEWLTEAAMPREPFAAGPTAVPVLYAAPGSPDSDDHLSADVFGSAFFMVTRYEELVGRTRDAHGRFPAEASIALRAGFLERPVVHEHAELLWARARGAWPRLARRRVPSLRPSHDVDWPWLPGRPAARSCAPSAGDVVRRRDPALALDRLRWEVARARGRLRPDPYDTFD